MKPEKIKFKFGEVLGTEVYIADEMDKYIEELLGGLKDSYLEGNEHDFGFSIEDVECAIKKIAKQMGWDEERTT